MKAILMQLSQVGIDVQVIGNGFRGGVQPKPGELEQ